MGEAYIIFQACLKFFAYFFFSSLDFIFVTMAFFASIILLIVLPSILSKSLYTISNTKQLELLDEPSKSRFSFSQFDQKNDFHELDLKEATSHYSLSMNSASKKLPLSKEKFKPVKSMKKVTPLQKKIRRISLETLESKHKSQDILSKYTKDKNSKTLESLNRGSNQDITLVDVGHTENPIDDHDHHISASSDGFESFQHRWISKKHDTNLQYAEDDKKDIEPDSDIEDGYQFTLPNQKPEVPKFSVLSGDVISHQDLKNFSFGINDENKTQSQAPNLQSSENNSQSLLKSFKDRWTTKVSRGNTNVLTNNTATITKSVLIPAKNSLNDAVDSSLGSTNIRWLPQSEHNFTCSLQKRGKILCIFTESNINFSSSKSLLVDSLKRSMKMSEALQFFLDKNAFNFIQCFFPSDVCKIAGSQASGHTYAEEIVLSQPWMLKNLLTQINN